MSLTPVICTQCGAKLEVEDNIDTIVCTYCGTSFINKIEKEDVNLDNTIAKEQKKPTIINIGGYEFSNEQGNHIIELLKKRKKIAAIKEFRKITGCGLKEATDAINLYEQQFHQSQTPSDYTYLDNIANERFIWRLIRLIFKFL